MLSIIKTAWINFRNERAYRKAVRQTIHELQKLTDYELNDIGMARGDIWSVAHDAQQKPKKLEVEDIRVNANIRGWV